MLRSRSVHKLGHHTLSTWNKWYQSCLISSRIVFVKTDASPVDVAHWNPRFHHDLQRQRVDDIVILRNTQNISYFRPISRNNSYAVRPGSLDRVVMINHFQKKMQEADNVSVLLGLLGTDDDHVFVDNRAKPQLLTMWLNTLYKMMREQCLIEEDLQVIKNDENFQKLLLQLDKNVLKMRVYDVIDALTCLLEIFPEDNSTIESIENQVRWLLRKMYLPNIEKILSLHERHQETALRQEMLTFIQAVEEKRWGELQDPADVITLMYAKDNVSDKFTAKVEEKALDLCGQMSTKSLYRVIYQLAKQKRRNTPLLRGAMYYLGCQPHINLSPVHLMNLLFALTNFKLYHPILFEKIAVSIMEKISNFEPHMAGSVLTSIGVAKFRHPKLLDTLTDYFHERIDSVSPKDLSSLVITLANLNYRPQNLLEYFPKFLEQLQSLKVSDKRTWLDIVWSSAILNRLSTEMVESVLEPEFYAEFSELHSFRATPCHLKLANISAIVKRDLPSYSGPFLPDGYLQSKDLNFSKRSERRFHTVILENLLNIAPGDKYAVTNVLTPSGSTIDVQLVINEEGAVQPYADYKPASDETQQDFKALPKNMHRISLRVNDFQDMTTYTVVPNGVSVMTSRLLEEKDCKLVELCYNDFPVKGTVVQKVAYLQGKIKDVIQ